MAERPHYFGHRDRLRERFDGAGAAALADYELLELLLFSAHKRGDTKPIAKALLKKFGSVGGVLGAEPAALGEVGGMGDVAVRTVKVVEALMLRALRERTLEADRPVTVLGSWQAVLDYCSAALIHRRTERFHVLYLDSRNKLIADEEQQRGTVDRVQLYPREVMKRALELGASAVILVHNHPSGDTEPSKADIDMTRQVTEAGAKLGVIVHDHLVIGRAEPFSFRAKGLL